MNSKEEIRDAQRSAVALTRAVRAKDVEAFQELLKTAPNLFGVLWALGDLPSVVLESINAHALERNGQEFVDVDAYLQMWAEDMAVAE